ncbi:MAG: DNA polymerase III subunit delta [Vicinamibacterales bacterium]
MPKVDLPALEKRIRNRQLEPVHLFVGEDVRLIERLVDLVEATVDEADRPFAVERLYAGDPGGAPIDIAAAARIYPMLGDRRIVIVLRAERFLKPKRASKAVEVESTTDDAEAAEAADMGPLEAYLEAPAPSTTLLFVATDVDRGRRLTKRLLEKATVTEFAGLSADGPAGRRDARAAVLEQVGRELAEAGRAIDSRVLGVLVDRAGGDINRLRGDIERLLLYTEGQARISPEDVDEIVTSHVSVEDEWAVVNAIAAGDTARALREVALRLDRGDSPHALVGQLRWWVSNRLAESDADRVRPAIESLLRTDLALKSSGGDERVLVERLIVELSGRPVPDRRWGPRR